jgi:nuclear transport factor 2 (NTF2) superfamily protein
MSDSLDADSLPPVEGLICEVLAARVRLGERSWPFPNRLRPALKSLTTKGFIEWDSAVVEGYSDAWFTDAGRQACLYGDYEAPDVAVDPALVERVAEVIPAPMASMHVTEWPPDEQDYYRSNGYRSFTEAEQELQRMRRMKVAVAVLAIPEIAAALARPAGKGCP